MHAIPGKARCYESIPMEGLGISSEAPSSSSRSSRKFGAYYIPSFWHLARAHFYLLVDLLEWFLYSHSTDIFPSANTSCILTTICFGQYCAFSLKCWYQHWVPEKLLYVLQDPDQMFCKRFSVKPFQIY
jgi:hypothetical protein